METNSLTYIASCLPKLFPYVGVTLGITAASILLALFCGFLLTLLHFTRLKKAVIFYINVMRGTPTLILILLVYYELPILLKLCGIEIDDRNQLFFAIVALTMNSCAYFSESMRSAYLAVDYRQLEAGLSIGMRKKDVIRRIIIPQSIVLALPNLGNTVISVIKNSSLVYAIGLTDLYQQGQKLANDTFGFRQLEVFIAVTLIYWLICMLAEALVELFEHKASYFLPGRRKQNDF